MNESLYHFGGFIRTGGTLDNGKPWHGFNVLLARAHYDDNGRLDLPRSGLIAKASYTDALHNALREAQPGSVVEVYFNDKGKIAHFALAGKE